MPSMRSMRPMRWHLFTVIGGPCKKVVLCVLCMVVYFPGAVEGPCKKFVMVPTIMSGHNCLSTHRTHRTLPGPQALCPMANLPLSAALCVLSVCLQKIIQGPPTHIRHRTHSHGWAQSAGVSSHVQNNLGLFW